MALATYQLNPGGVAQPQTQSGDPGAADVNVVGGLISLDPSGNAITGLNLNNARTGAAAASIVVKATAGKLYRVNVYNAKGSAQFIQIHDSATLPAEGAVPIVSLNAATVANLVIDFGINGLNCINGITICNSSTVATKTIGSADCTVSAQYL